jgi:hypothetical protein
MDEPLDRLRELGISRADAAEALNVSLTDLDHWVQGELRTEIADVIEVGLTLLAMRLRGARLRCEELTVRIAVA